MERGTRTGDDERVIRATAGDGEALEELLETFGPRVRLALSIQPGRRRDFDADDVMQVTYLEAFLRIGGLKTRTAGGFASWLTRIAENNLRDAVRGLERHKRGGAEQRVTRGPDGETARTLIGRLASPTTQGAAGGQLSATGARDILHAALERLPASYRDVVVRCDLEERNVRDVAEALGSSAGAVHMLRTRAHDRLRELLGSQADLFPDSA